MIEPSITAQAAERATEADLHGLRLILEALQSGSPTAAEAAMADHIESIGRIIAER